MTYVKNIWGWKKLKIFLLFAGIHCGGGESILSKNIMKMRREIHDDISCTMG